MRAGQHPFAFKKKCCCSHVLSRFPLQRRKRGQQMRKTCLMRSSCGFALEDCKGERGRGRKRGCNDLEVSSEGNYLGCQLAITQPSLGIIILSSSYFSLFLSSFGKTPRGPSTRRKSTRYGRIRHKYIHSI